MLDELSTKVASEPIIGARHIASVGYLRVGRDYGRSQADRGIVRLRDGILEGSGSCSTDTQLASSRPDRKGRQVGDLALRVVPGFFGTAFFYVFFAAFGGFLRVLWPLFAHPVLLLIVRSLHCPPGKPNFTPHSPAATLAHHQNPDCSSLFWRKFAWASRQGTIFTVPCEPVPTPAVSAPGRRGRGHEE
jgi:hypothetical protein